MTVTHIPRDPSHRYLSLEETIARDYFDRASHHLARAAMHEANGNYEFAFGSRRKAQKWLRKLDQILDQMNTPWRRTMLPLLAPLAQAMEQQVMQGDGTDHIGGLLS